MVRTFISYAREDDERFVRRLYRDLMARDLFVWWDRKAMESRGRTFLDEIRAAIASVERLILVVGPKAATSRYVMQEWEFAAESCKVIVPILRLGRSGKASNEDYELVPTQLSKLHSPDFRRSRSYREALDELVGILSTPLLPPGTLHGVDTLPPHYLSRAEPLDRLNKLVFPDSSQPIVITASKGVTALEGMAGIGKSVLATAFARACGTRRRFNHGVIWLRLGRKPGLTKILAFAALALNDDPGKYLDPQAGSARLSQALANRNCLLILDDVWKMEDAEPILNALGIGCRALITTRDSGLALALGARELPLDVMTGDEALTLLSLWSDHAVAQLPAQAREVAIRCGNLPLAIAMIGAMVKNKPSSRWSDVLSLMQHADLESIHQRFPNYPYPDLLRAMEVSVRALKPKARDRYMDFGVFPNNTPVPEAVIEVYWRPLGLNPAVTHQFIDLFVDRSLMRRDPARRLSLHDLQLDYVRKQCSDLPSLHHRLLAAYQAQCKAGWHTGPNDGYYFSHLLHHLIEAGRGDEVHGVLAAEMADGRNGWYEAKEALGDGFGYRLDVARAWQLAETSGKQSTLWPSVGHECRYALAGASLNSVGGSIPPLMLAALVRNGIWSPEHALAYAVAIADPKPRAEALAGLAPQLSEPLIRTALAATQRAEALAALCPRLAEVGYPLEALALMLKPPVQPYDQLADFHRNAVDLVLRVAELGYPEQALAAVPKLDRFERQRIWPALATLLPKSTLARVLAVALPEPGETGRDTALIALAPHLRRTDLASALDAAFLITNEMNRVWALGGLAPFLPEPMLRSALAHARQIDDVLARARALVALAVRLPKSTRSKAFAEALTAVRRIEHHAFRAAELSKLAQHLNLSQGNKVFKEALRAIELAGESHEKRGALVSLVPHLPRKLLPKALLVAQSIAYPVERARTLAELVPQLPVPFSQETLDAALAGAKALGSIDERARALIRLLPLVSETRRAEVLDEVLTDTLQEEEFRDRAFIFRLLVPELPEVKLGQALGALPKVRPFMDRAEMLTNLIPFITQPLGADALAAARSLQLGEQRAKALAVLASRLSGPLQAEAVRDALAEASEVPAENLFAPHERADVRNLVATHLPQAFLRGALALMRRISDDPQRAKALAGLAPWLSGPRLQCALDAVLRTTRPLDSNQPEMFGRIALRFAELGLPNRALDAIRHIPVYRDNALCDLASCLATRGYFRHALAAVRAIDSDSRRSQSLIALAPVLPEAMLPRALSAARTVGEEYKYIPCEVLCKLFPRLAEPLRGETFRELLGLAGSIHPSWRGWMFKELAPHLTEGRLREAVAYFRESGEIPSEPEPVAELAHYLPEPDRSEILREAFAAAKELPASEMTSGRHPRAEALIRMVSLLSGPLRQDAVAAGLAASRQIADPSGKVAALVSLVGVLEEPLKNDVLAEVVEAAEGIVYSSEKAKALSQLAEALTGQLLLRALQAARQIEETGDRVKVLAALAARLPEPERGKNIAETWSAAATAHASTEAFFALAEHLPEPLRSQALNEALSECRSFGGHQGLAKLAEYLPTPLKAEVLRDAAAVALTRYFIGDRVTALGDLVPSLVSLPAEDLLPIWRRILRSLALESRQDLLSYLQPLGPVIFALGGQKAVEETFHAILDVGRWWP